MGIRSPVHFAKLTQSKSGRLFRGACKAAKRSKECSAQHLRTARGPTSATGRKLGSVLMYISCVSQSVHPSRTSVGCTMTPSRLSATRWLHCVAGDEHRGACQPSRAVPDGAGSVRVQSRRVFGGDNKTQYSKAHREVSLPLRAMPLLPRSRHGESLHTDTHTLMATCKSRSLSIIYNL
eukprot:1399619-Pyramimonas_sp.AAC.2